jgi:Sugar-specific transcriptional regulator TrmB
VLDALGLSPDSETVYEALLRGGPASAPELATGTGLRLARVRALLRQLEADALVTRGQGSPTRYAPVDPDIALDVLLLRREEQLRRARARARELSESYHREAPARDPAQLVEVVVGRDLVTQRVQQAQRSARHQLRYLDKPPYASDPTNSNQAELDFLRDGGEARVVYEPAALDIPGRLRDLEAGIELGEQARSHPQLPTKLILVDDRLGLLPLLPSPMPAIDSCVIVHRSSLLDALSALFEAYWGLAAPLRFDSTVDHTEPDQRRLLALMGAGLSDAAIGRQLGISYRTLQRRIHDLMAGMHAQTRFQLGVRATTEGSKSNPS